MPYIQKNVRSLRPNAKTYLHNYSNYLSAYLEMKREEKIGKSGDYERILAACIFSFVPPQISITLTVYFSLYLFPSTFFIPRTVYFFHSFTHSLINCILPPTHSSTFFLPLTLSNIPPLSVSLPIHHLVYHIHFILLSSLFFFSLFSFSSLFSSLLFSCLFSFLFSSLLHLFSSLLFSSLFFSSFLLIFSYLASFLSYLLATTPERCQHDLSQQQS